MWDWLRAWSSNPTSILAGIAVIALIWQVGRWTQRIENGLQRLGERIDAQGTSLGERIDAQGTSLGERIDAQGTSLKERIDAQGTSLGERIDAQGTSLKERIDAQGTSLGERIDTGLKTLRDEVRQQESETRRTLDILLLRVAGSAQTAAGNSPLKLTEFGKRIEASLDPGEWIAATTEELRPRTEGLEPFEIDALCEEYVRNGLDREWQRRVARAAYEFGSDDRAVGDVLRVLLREALVTGAETPPTLSTVTTAGRNPNAA